MSRPHSIDQEMPLPALYALVRVVATDAGRLLNGLHTLAVHDGSARVRMVTDALTLCPMQGGIEHVPDTLEVEASDVVKHRLPGWKVAGEVTPRTAGAHHVEDGVKDLAQWVRARSAAV
jgi:hypothetical protein